MHFGKFWIASLMIESHCNIYGGKMQVWPSSSLLIQILALAEILVNTTNLTALEHRLYVFQGTIPEKRTTEKNTQPKILFNTLILQWNDLELQLRSV